MLHLLAAKDSPTKKYLIIIISASVGLLILTSIYIFAVRIFICDMESLGISVSPKSNSIPYYMSLLVSLTLIIVIMTLKFRNSKKILTLIALFMLIFYVALHIMIVLYMIFYAAPDMSVIYR